VIHLFPESGFYAILYCQKVNFPVYGIIFGRSLQDLFPTKLRQIDLYFMIKRSFAKKRV